MSRVLVSHPYCEHALPFSWQSASTCSPLPVQAAQEAGADATATATVTVNYAPADIGIANPTINETVVVSLILISRLSQMLVVALTE